MRDLTLEETAYFMFSTRAFASGVPTSLLGTPVLSVLESNNATPITAGVSVNVDRASVTGLNQATVVATAANGYEAGKSYAVYISTGTVGGVSVVGEVVAEFTVQASAAFTRIGAAGAGLTAITGVTLAASQPGVTIPTVTTLTGHTAQTGDAYARLGAPAGASLAADVAAVKVDTAAVKVKTDFLPSAAAGAAGGVFIAGTNAATSITTALTATFTGNLSGTVGGIAGTTQTLDALQAAQNAAHGAGSWATAVGFSTHAAADVWAVGTRTLTSFGTLVADAAAAVWAAVSRTITGTVTLDATQGSYAPAKVSDIPTAAALSDAVWDEVLSGHLTAGTTGNALNAAGAAGDPWTTALPGAYGAGTAGKIIGDNINATLSSRASQTSVDDLPTTAELATALGTADDATLAAIAALNNLSAAGVRTAVGLASANLDTQLDALPTNAELATALGTADDATLAAIAALSIPTAAANAAATAAQVTTDHGAGSYIRNTEPVDVSTNVAAIKAKTDLIPAAPAAVGDAMTLTSAYDFAKGTVAMTESYAADGATMTPAQAFHMIWSMLSDKAIVGTTLTTKKLNGATTAMTFQLDSGTSPTSQARAT